MTPDPIRTPPEYDIGGGLSVAFVGEDLIRLRFSFDEEESIALMTETAFNVIQMLRRARSVVL